jgi:hypothetical protein
VLALSQFVDSNPRETNHRFDAVGIGTNHKCPIVIGMLNLLDIRKAAVTQMPVEVPDELFASLRQHFDPLQMVELTSAIAWENYRARFDHAFGIEAEGFSAGPEAGCARRDIRSPGTAERTDLRAV